jgi:hypothetical protein
MNSKSDGHKNSSLFCLTKNTRTWVKMGIGKFDIPFYPSPSLGGNCKKFSDFFPFNHPKTPEPHGYLWVFLQCFFCTTQDQ